MINVEWSAMEHQRSGPWFLGVVHEAAHKKISHPTIDLPFQDKGQRHHRITGIVSTKNLNDTAVNTSYR